MALFDAVDQYCERLTPELWAEPLNAWSNAAFLLAAVLLWRAEPLRLTGGARRDVRVFAALIALVGIGSFTFHTVATVFAMIADVAPIIAALLWFLWVYLRRAAGLAPFAAMLGFVAFGAVTGAFAALVPAAAVNGSQTYFGCVVALAAMGLHAGAARGLFFTAAVLLSLSLACRSIDMWICPALPIGTHFLWHVLNALTLYIAAKGLTRALQPRQFFAR